MDVMAPFTYFITSRLHVEETKKLTLWSDKIRKGRREKGGGILRQYIFFFSPPATFYLILSHSVSFLSFLSLSSLSLTWLFPFNDLRDTYCVFSFRLNFIGKKHTSEHRFDARTRVWNTPLKIQLHKAVKIHKKDSTLEHWNTLAPECVSVHAHTCTLSCTRHEWGTF